MAARRTLVELGRLRPASPAAFLRMDHVASSLVIQQTPHSTGGVGCPQYLTVQRTVSTSVPPGGAPVGAALTYTGRVLLHGIHDLPYEPQVHVCPPHATPCSKLLGCHCQLALPPQPTRPCRCMAHTSGSLRGLYRPLRMLEPR